MVNIPHKMTFFTLLAAVWLVLAVICAGVFIIVEHDHQHVDTAGHPVLNGDNCKICYELQIAQRIIEAFGRLGLSMAVISSIAVVLSSVKPQRAFFLFNPIELKIKFIC